jgi:hypothetical protein
MADINSPLNVHGFLSYPLVSLNHIVIRFAGWFHIDMDQQTALWGYRGTEIGWVCRRVVGTRWDGGDGMGMGWGMEKVAV